MFAIVHDGKITGFLSPDLPFTLGDTQYPSNWLSCATEAERTALGIFPVRRDVRPFSPYSVVEEAEPYWDAATATVRIGYTATARDLEEVRALEIDGVKGTAGSLLASSDWRVVRAMEDPNKPLGEVWQGWRNAIRAEADRVEDLIRSAGSVEDLANAVSSVNWPPSPTA